MGEPKTCFVAMPITTRAPERERYDDPDHWEHVYQYLIKPALEKAGWTPIEPTAHGPEHITDAVVRQLCTAELVLCDLSFGNPNVFFELGIRTALNLPVAVIHDKYVDQLPFDVAALNAYRYSFSPHALAEHVSGLGDYVRRMVRPQGGNPFWRVYGKKHVSSQGQGVQPTDSGAAKGALTVEKARLEADRLMDDARRAAARLKEEAERELKAIYARRDSATEELRMAQLRRLRELLCQLVARGGCSSSFVGR